MLIKDLKMPLVYTSGKDGLVRQELLRKLHHKVAHLKGTEKDFTKFCENASKLARYYFTRQKKLREKKVEEVLEEKQFQCAVGNGHTDDPVDVIFIEDIESGKVLFYDSGPTIETQPLTNIKDKTQPVLRVGTQSVEISEFYPEGYQLQPHRKVRIQLALRRIKFRARNLAKCNRVFSKKVFKSSVVKQRKLSDSSTSNSSSSSSSDSLSNCSNSSCDSSDDNISYSSSSEDEQCIVKIPKSLNKVARGDDKCDLKTSKLLMKIYNLSTKIGDAIIQSCFLDLKIKKEVKNDEIWFYRKVCEIVEWQKSKCSHKFNKIESPQDYIKWVTFQTNFVPKPLDEVKVSQPLVSAYVPDRSMQELLSPSTSNINDFHRAVAFVKKAKIYTKEDLENNKVIFGGTKASCKCSSKFYPFQEMCYTTKNARGENVVRGLEQRKVEISIPTINLLPYLHPDLKLRFL